ncbi:MAG: hypothetical protein IPL61_36495 [Myxococcales bacterium]|nr:hypothetical protein [Myxococcales bacterium]
MFLFFVGLAAGLALSLALGGGSRAAGEGVGATPPTPASDRGRRASADGPRRDVLRPIRPIAPANADWARYEQDVTREEADLEYAEIMAAIDGAWRRALSGCLALAPLTAMFGYRVDVVSTGDEIVVSGAHIVDDAEQAEQILTCAERVLAQVVRVPRRRPAVTPFRGAIDIPALRTKVESPRADQPELP